ncbi:MAG: hypothetical protein K9K66_08040 [Desulfarculaceae bacterium]|nr:hypothetical protein [Desulfarculaceae bacterium]MCF8072076.1 hypothetical protein [Desulfarculaceae bacterium]MCF8101593.1 hypothetical protein [Desulfarculaceae bacterium]MCF8115143.1 hypothetical protein [Desulfarculaceae bacterium]
MKFSKFTLATILALSLGLAAGCSIFSAQPVGAEKTQDGKAGKAKPAGAPASIGRYYDFDDIQVPNALKLDKKRSLIFRAGKFKAGVLVFTDNLEVQSLINFFIDSMQKDNWILQGSYKYPRVVLFFAKKGKTAVINILEDTFSTEVTIWVAPTVE